MERSILAARSTQRSRSKRNNRPSPAAETSDPPPRRGRVKSSLVFYRHFGAMTHLAVFEFRGLRAEMGKLRVD